MSNVITRFAPSPTGMLHLGNVRTALLNWLYARKHDGQFRLRFEDTDRDRSEAKYIKAIQEDITWLGLGWDGDVLFQSAHADKHAEALEKLADQGLAYRCFCTEHQLALDRKLATSRGLPPRYHGRCRLLSTADSDVRVRSEPYVWRLAVHRDDAGAGSAEVIVHDVLRGDVHFHSRDLDDPVIVRSDGTFTFLLPNAVDDAVDGITHVLRGDDHLTNSAYQVWLLERLGYAPPAYLHHGLLLGEDGSKLSKRTGSYSIAELRGQGLLPAALVQVMARLGHPNMPDDVTSVHALAGCFEAEHVSTSSVKWVDGEMWRWHARLLHALPPEEMALLIRSHVPETDTARLQAFAALIGGNLQRAEDAAGFVCLLDADAETGADATAIIREAGADFYNCALKAWQKAEKATDGPEWKAWTADVKAQTGRKGKGLFLPLRAALTGALHGPEMSEVVSFLGADGVTSRLKKVIGRIS
ncbi:MAG: glutamate--tRNA ligase [Mariprofundaceae bacterium]